MTQVFPVPLTPLELLVASPATAGLISQETVFIANVGLWRVRVFNEFVRMQTDFNVRLMVDVRDAKLPSERREAIAEASSYIAQMLHVFGIGGANVEGGWYRRLKQALDADIQRLAEQRAQGFFDYGESRKWLLLGDVGMAALVAALAVTVVIRAIYG